jgi:Ser/Thr protein kinase RdoA (MazF antagonist)
MTANQTLDGHAKESATAEVFARNALSAYSFPEDTHIRLVSMSENATFMLEHGEPVGILRVYRQDYQSAAAVRSELAWIDAVRDDGIVKTPAVLRTRDDAPVQWITVDGITRACAVFDYVDGRQPTPDDRQTYHLVGGIGAALHIHAEQWDRPEWFTRTKWDLNGILGMGAPWGQWADGPGLDGAGTALLQRADSRVRTRLGTYPASAPAAGLVHCDLRSANLLKDATGAVWVIDFDDAGFSWYLWDLCSSTTFEEHTPHVRDIIDAWLTGYREVRPLSARDVSAIPDLVFLRRLHVLAWLGSHPESDLARDLGDSYTLATYELAENYLNGRFLNDL